MPDARLIPSPERPIATPRRVRRFLGFWRRALITSGRIGLTLGTFAGVAVGGSIIAYWQEAHTRGRIWWIVGGAVALVVILMLAAFREWEHIADQLAEAKTELEELERQPVPDEHRDQLHDMLRGTAQQTWNGNRVGYGDAVNGEPHNRTVFLAHFPAVANQLDRWDQLVDRRDAARHGLLRAFDAEATKTGLPTAEYDGWEAVKDAITTLVGERARAENQRTPFTLNVGITNYAGVHGPKPGPGKELEITLGDKAVAHLPLEPGHNRQERCDVIGDQLTELCTALDESAAADEACAVHQAEEDARPLLRDEISSWQKVTIIRSETACPTCRRNLGLEPASAIALAHP